MEKSFFADEYFTFSLGSVMYAITVDCVKEVLDFEKLTKVPKALPYLKGVMNIRGSVVTIVDLRILFDITGSQDIEKLPIIVTEIPRPNDTNLTLGIIADSVDVVTKLEEVPSDSVAYGTLPHRDDFVKAIGKKDGKFVLILDLPVILDSI
ncbi:MAG TPA: chemotaxis protein CheW, partial [Candidatus Treponema faecavium]|nr:chemotaxis protein CheW [Candidatus Treponema faecavium]